MPDSDHESPGSPKPADAEVDRPPDSETGESPSSDRSVDGQAGVAAADSASDTTIVGGPTRHPRQAAADLWNRQDREPQITGSGSLKSDFGDWLRQRADQRTELDDTVSTLSEVDSAIDAPVLPMAVEDVYEDRGEIGRGGMGSVRRVLDRRLRREAALKILKPEVGRRHREVRRFVEEAQITGQLDHPNVVPIHELGQDASGSHYFTMKLVQGRTLEEALDQAGDDRLEPEALADFLQILVKVCEAVAFAHSRGVVHRDLKPANIMVGEYGQVYVMDWGIARLVAPDVDGDLARTVVTVSRSESTDIDSPGSIIGTPRYMAPEQVAGNHEATDHRADVFALGGILYHLLTGHAPYTEQNYFSLLVMVQNRELVRPAEIEGCEHVPAELERIAMKAMAKEAGDRYPSVVALKKDIERFMRGVWHLPTEHFAAGSAIVTEGDEGDAAYIIKSGCCRVLKNINGQPTEVRTMGAGDVFGETAIFSSARRSATVEAIEDVEVTVVTSEILTQGLGLNSWMGDFVRALANRFREVDERLHEQSLDELSNERADGQATTGVEGS